MSNLESHNVFGCLTLGAPTLLNVGDGNANVIWRLILELRHYLTSNVKRPTLFLKLTSVGQVTNINFSVLFTKMSPIIFNIEFFLDKHGMGDYNIPIGNYLNKRNNL